MLHDLHYNVRHWDFIKQSIVDINKELIGLESKVLSVSSDVIGLCNQIQNFYAIDTVYSHIETGILTTYVRDKEFKRYCRNNNISWKENINNGVQRGLQHREKWYEDWEFYMKKKQEIFNPLRNQILKLEEIKEIEKISHPISLQTPSGTKFQKGGRSTGIKYLTTFFNERHKEYMFHISKPELSRTSCSRLSPYLAWGNLSVREVFQEGKKVKTKANTRHIGAFLSRLRWQAHFIQKFEMEHVMENASVNKGYHKLKKSISKKYQVAWKTGTTGYPLVDACMRAVEETGWINFRMRAMVVSFFSLNLDQDWRDGTYHLAKQFLDYEPGIHYTQFQMQASTTGINTVRLYNPVKNSQEHDPCGAFIKKWIPELEKIEPKIIHNLWIIY